MKEAPRFHVLEGSKSCSDANPTLPRVLGCDMIKARSRNPYSVMREMDRSHQEIIAFQFGSPEFRCKRLGYYMTLRAIEVSHNQHA